MEIITLDLNSATEEQLIMAIEKNNRLITTLQKNIASLQTKSAKVLDIQDMLEMPVSIEKTNEPNKEEDCNFTDEVDYYFAMINSYTESAELLNLVETSIPSKKNSNYNNIILGIKLELLKEIKEYEELLGTQENFTKSELQEFLDVINLNKKKIDLLTKIENTSDVDDQMEEIENNFVFVPTSGGNIRVLDEISNMPIEFLDGFKGLFASIKDGTFKNVKRFNSNKNNKSSGVSEVKDSQIRVIFDRIGKNDYALVTAFIKKCDNDKGYIESMSLKIKNYLDQKESLKANLSNHEFRKIQEEYTKELYNILNKEELKTPTYKKGGVSNV